METSRVLAKLARLKRDPWELPALIWKNLIFPFTAKAAEMRYDRKMGIETAGSLGPFELGLSGSRAEQSTGYDATPPGVFNDLMDRLGDQVNGFTFIDIGAGKGRVLLLAAFRSFARVIGLELSPRLCEIARRNIAAFVPRYPGLAPIEVVHADATEYAWPHADCVLFLFNPLGPVAMRQIADNLRASYLAAPRKIVIVYYHPKYADVFDPEVFERRELHDLPKDPTERRRVQKFIGMILESRGSAP